SEGCNASDGVHQRTSRYLLLSNTHDNCPKACAEELQPHHQQREYRRLTYHYVHSLQSIRERRNRTMGCHFHPASTDPRKCRPIPHDRFYLRNGRGRGFAGTVKPCLCLPHKPCYE